MLCAQPFWVAPGHASSMLEESEPARVLDDVSDGLQRKIDRLDRSIMATLSRDPQSSNTGIAQKLGVSEFTVANRIESLIADRVMKITIQRDVRTLGFGIIGIVEVFVEGETVLSVAAQLAKIPESISETIFVDSPQIAILLMARDFEHFHQLVDQEIAGLAGVADLNTTLFLETLCIKAGIAAL
jgi:DNA-binding Lrp family transcriptional regulator